MPFFIKAPSKYIQGRGELKNIGLHSSYLGSAFYCIASANIQTKYGSVIRKSFQDIDSPLSFGTFSGDCTKSNIFHHMDKAKSCKADVIIGFGGGKAIDTAKAVAENLGQRPVVIIPSAASNDAPCSGLSVIYNEQGALVKALITQRNPDLVLVDTQIVAHSPPRLFAAGIGDALSTYYEVRAVKASASTTMAGGTCSNFAYAIGELCANILNKDAAPAYDAVCQKAVTPSLENATEAVIYLSGVGFESGGIAVAHAVQDGFSTLPFLNNLLHGEKVAYGILVQLVLENDLDALYSLLPIFRHIGLPIVLSDLGAATMSYNHMLQTATVACSPREFAQNMPFPVTPSDIVDAIRVVDSIGKTQKVKHS